MKGNRAPLKMFLLRRDELQIDQWEVKVEHRKEKKINLSGVAQDETSKSIEFFASHLGIKGIDSNLMYKPFATSYQRDIQAPAPLWSTLPLLELKNQGFS